MMKYSVCNELFGDYPIEKAAEILSRTGYQGIEFAPYTMFGNFTDCEINSGIRKIKSALSENGLEFVGFHWLLVGPEDYDLTSPKKNERLKAIEHLKKLLAAANEMGGGVLVLGSPKQRSTVPGQSISDAVSNLAESLASLADMAVTCNSKILIEALSSDQTDVINTLEQAKSLIKKINSPGISGMFDFHNVGDENESWEKLISKYYEIIQHIHINEMDGNTPGSGKSDYRPTFRLLNRLKYSNWISMEIFSKPVDPEDAVKKAMRFMLQIDNETK